jgi:two-component system cell cycle response regulator
MNAHDALRTILEVSDALAGEVEFDRALTLVADAALAITGASHASVRLLAPGEGVLLATARAGEGIATAAKPFRRGEGLMGWVVDHGQGLVVDDVHAEPRYREVPGQGFVIGSMVLEPLVVGGVVGGVLSASSPSVASFRETEVLGFKLLARCTQFPLERARLQRLAIVDQLTLAFAPSTLRPSLDRALQDARGRGSPFSLLFFDLDRFKGINDRYGHAVGDEVLRRFASEVRSTIRKHDVFVRRGGEEFVLLLPDTDAGAAFAMAERIRSRVRATAIDVGGTLVHVTTSVGVATWNGEESGATLEHRADAAVYAAKASGRDRCVVANDEPPSSDVVKTEREDREPRPSR